MSDNQNITKKWLDLFKLIPNYDVLVLSEGYYFDEAAAMKPIEFFEEMLNHVKGNKSKKPFVLEDWQKAVTGCLFGWKSVKTDFRRYKECLVYVAKKNGKSAWIAGLILYMLVCDGEHGAEIYSAASCQKQANIVFEYVEGMIKLEPLLAGILKTYGTKGGSVARSVTYDGEMSSYKCIAKDADSADGANVHMAAIDELHRHKSAELSDVLQKSSAARDQALVIYMTTADYNRPESPCNVKLKYAKQVAENKNDPAAPGFNPKFLPVIYECSMDDAWNDPDTKIRDAVWDKANPNRYVTMAEDFLEDEYQKALDVPSELNNFLRLHLNIVTDADQAWITMADWDKCGDEDPLSWRTRMLESLKGRPCTMALDLSSTNDLTALVLDFYDDGNILIPFFWMPKDCARKREREHKVPYLTWIRQGFVEATDGNCIDYDFVFKRVEEIADNYKCKELIFDRYMAGQIISDCAKAGIELVEFGQGFRDMTAPSKAFETMVLSGTLKHGSNPVLRWCVANTMIEMDAAGNIKPSKKKSAEKIDGTVAAVMAISGAMVAVDNTSVYETRGILTV
ncbi:terminase large subunit [Candidatus Pacearchaeota archaeon]|nr:terminase large subunit [Candidatus Pacearchaeota archaeon]